MWFNVLKTQETITDLGLDFESPDEKLEPKDKPEDDKCCEEARSVLDDYHRNGTQVLGYETTYHRTLDCDELSKHISHVIDRMLFPNHILKIPHILQKKQREVYMDAEQTWIECIWADAAPFEGHPFAPFNSLKIREGR